MQTILTFIYPAQAKDVNIMHHPDINSHLKDKTILSVTTCFLDSKFYVTVVFQTNT